MLSVRDAYAIVLNQARDFGTETIPLHQGIGRILREDWHSDRELPPYDRVTMDGIAVHYATAVQQAQLVVAGVVAAGDPEAELADPTQCLEIMTGAMLPRGCDTIIRYEDVTIENGRATINETYQQGQNIHTQGQDRQAGELLVPAGTLLSASEIGVGASVGRADIQVARFPKTIIISTGNELVEVHETPAAHQIRRSNVYRLQATLNHWGLTVATAHLPDDEDLIVSALTTFVADYDLVVLSGGVSKGKFDFLPAALAKIGVEKHFHVIAQRPGKPLWFGTHPVTKTTVFALPGNPVSSFMCTQVYLQDWLKASLGQTIAPLPHGILQAEVRFKPALTYFLEVKIAYDAQGRILAFPQQGNGSGDLANLLNADAFIRLPPDREYFGVGEVFPIYGYR
ncbi:MAG: molybdopterin molybdenumtransferase MoeA [Bacteroidetes bacterium]|nr:MAG: molybdopterin molybdenumtransferase MoeA [Bacteroidota bacterium]